MNKNKDLNYLNLYIIKLLTEELVNSNSPNFTINEWDAYDPYCSNQMFFRECSHQ